MIKFISEDYKIQAETTYIGQINAYGELVVKSQYMNCMQDKKMVLGKITTTKNIIVTTCKTV